MKERRKSLLSNEKMVSYTGPSTGNTHKQHSHRELFYDQEGTGRVRKKGSLG